jgi:hypothetical protein
MPSLNVGKLIGLNLTAKKRLTAYNFPNEPKKVLFYVLAGGKTGSVYSYLEKPDGIYLQFNRSGGSYYYIKYEPDSFVLSDEIVQLIKLDQLQLEKQLIAEKGAIPYYIEKYGKFILGAVLITTLISVYIKKKA